MAETIQTKRCSKCKHFRPLSDFHKDKRAKNGLLSSCKQCQKSKDKQYYQQHQEKKHKYNKRYNQFHKSENREYQNQYYKTIQGHLHRVWRNMLHRCNNPKNPRYKDWGGRGIKLKFASFKDFYDYVVKELKVDPRGLTIDRINNDGHYEPGNIRFVSHAENCQNRRVNFVHH